MGQSRKGRACCSKSRRQAVSSGQAARYCLVSPDTIVNWIAGGKIPAQRTVGGQFRIRVDELRTFMLIHGMRTDQLDRDMDFVPFCWEFWGALAPAEHGGAHEHPCGQCPVYRSHATACFEVRPLLPGGTPRAPSCADCLYFSTVRENQSDA